MINDHKYLYLLEVFFMLIPDYTESRQKSEEALCSQNRWNLGEDIIPRFLLINCYTKINKHEPIPINNK